MSLTRRLAGIAVAFAAAAALALLPRTAAAQAAATFLAAIGNVQVVDAAGQQRTGERGGALAPGDRIVVGAGGLAQLRFSDGGLVSLRASSELRIDAYAFRGGEDTAASSVLQLVQGGLRAITGAIARLNRTGYSVVTTNATIGVRGTDFEAFHIPVPVPGGPAPAGEPGTYLKVNQGIAFMQTQGGVLDVQPQQVGFVPRASVVPNLLPQVPQFMRSQPPAPAPPQQPQQRSEQPTRTPGTSTGPAQSLPGRVLTAPTVEPRTLQSPTTSPTLTSPTLSPSITSPTTTSPTLSPSTTSPTLTAPTTSPIMTAPTTSPTMTAPTTSPTMTAPATSPIMTAPTTSPIMTAPPTSPIMTAPR